VISGLTLFFVVLTVSAVLAPTVGSVESESGSSEGTVIGIHGGGPGLHEHGSVVQLDGRNPAWRAGGTESYFDVTKLANGNVAAGFMDGGYQDCGPYDAPCAHTGFRIIDPNTASGPEVVSEFSFPVRTRANSEVHDVEPLPEGGFVVTDMEYERIMIVRNGSVVWQWNASSFYRSPPDPTRTDWLHINDVDYIGDDRFLVSVRNANQVLVVERQEQGGEVVEVVNEAASEGEKRRGDPELIDHQHNPQWLGPGAILVADSENNRVVELHRDNSTGEWRVAWSLSGTEGVGFQWPRDADRLENGNTLVTDSANQRIVEVNRSGATVWSYRTRQVPYEADRLPGGEGVSDRRYDATSAGTEAPDGGMPIVSRFVQVLKTSVPLPHWITDYHAVLAVVCGGMVVSGLIVRRRGPVG
jgi:hypothetical protein